MADPLFIRSPSAPTIASISLSTSFGSASNDGVTVFEKENGKDCVGGYEDERLYQFAFYITRLLMIIAGFCSVVSYTNITPTKYWPTNILIPLHPPHPSSLSANVAYIIFSIIITSYFTFSLYSTIFNTPTPKFLQKILKEFPALKVSLTQYFLFEDLWPTIAMQKYHSLSPQFCNWFCYNFH